MATDVGTLVVHTQVDTSGVVKGFNVVKSEIKAVTSQIGLISNSVKGTFSSLMSLKNIIVGSFAIGAIKSAVNAYAQAEAAQEGLSSAIRATNQSVASLMPNLQKLQGDIQRLTIYEDDAVAAAQKLAVNMGVSGTAIEDVTKAAVALGQYYGDNLEASTQAVIRATQGQWRELGRLFPEIKNANSESERMAILNRKVAEGMQQAQERAKTTAGAFKQFQNVMGDVWEEVGNGIVDGISKLTIFKENAQGLVAFISGTEFKDAIRKVFSDLVQIVGGLATAFGEVMKSFVDMVNDIGGNYGILIGLAAIFAAINSKALLLVTSLAGVASVYKEISALQSLDTGDRANFLMRDNDAAMLDIARRRDAAKKLYESGGMSRSEYAQVTSELARQTQTRVHYGASLGQTRNEEYRNATNSAETVQAILDGLKSAAAGISNVSADINEIQRIAQMRGPQAVLGTGTLASGAAVGDDGTDGHGAKAAEDEIERLRKKLIDMGLDADTAARAIYVNQMEGLERILAEYEDQLKDVQARMAIVNEDAKNPALAEEAAKTLNKLRDQQAAIEVARAGAVAAWRDEQDKLAAAALQKQHDERDAMIERYGDERQQAELTHQHALDNIAEALKKDIISYADGIKFRRNEDARYRAELRELDEKEEAAAIKRAEELRQSSKEAITGAPKGMPLPTDIATISQKYKEMIDSLKVQFGSLGEYVTTMMDGITGGMSSGFQALMDGTKSFSGAVDEMCSDIASTFNKMVADMVAQWAMMQIKDMFMGSTTKTATGTSSSTGWLSTATSWVSDLFGFAKGGAFRMGNLIPFANGGVVTMPTVFPMANGTGLMSEKEIEAIMPLKRMPGGALGVQAQINGGAQAAAPNINIHVHAADSESIVSMMARNPAAIIGPLQQYLQRGGQLAGLTGA